MPIKLLSLFCFSLLLSIQVSAADKDPVNTIRTKLAELVPGVKPDSIKPTPVAGMYEVSYGAEILYLSEDGRYMFRGNLIDIEQREDLTENRRSKARKAALDNISEEEMIVYAPKNPKHMITVFTDIDCPYCRKFHAEMNQYQDLGIAVRYLMFPRHGEGSDGFKKAVNVWCAENSNKAMDRAKGGKSVKTKSCNNPVKQQMQLGQMIGVTGTPAIVLENGDLIPGYQPAERLAALLDEMKQERK